VVTALPTGGVIVIDPPVRSSVPVTGDKSNVTLWLALMAMAVIGGMVAGRRIRVN